MPIEIREINIKVSVGSNQEPDSEDAPQMEEDGINKDEIISECVEQVLEIIKKQTER